MNKFHEEYREVSRYLEKFHTIFFKLWEHGTPEITERIPTAALEFDPKSGKPLRFLFNPVFWDSIDSYTKAFVVAHECCHAINNHGYRAKSLIESGANTSIINQAMDVAINHILTSSFGFDRELINGAEDYCWVDTVFQNSQISDNLAFEEYYEILKNQSENENDSDSEESGEGSGEESHEQSDSKTVDSHDSLFGFESYELIDEINDKIDNYEVQSFNDKIEGSGDSSAGFRVIPPKAKLFATEKWNKLVKNWKRTGYNPPDENMQWVMPNRRLASLPDDIILPSDFEAYDEEYCKSKINLWIFVDVSASCEHIWEQFFLAVDTIPDRKFNKRIWSFASIAQEVKGRNIHTNVGFGTSFYSVVQTVNYEIGKNNNPDIIMVITDGDAVHPSDYPFANKWHYFIDATYDERDIDVRKKKADKYKAIVPKNINTHYLIDYFVPASVQNKVNCN
jgi:hypothetical protein